MRKKRLGKWIEVLKKNQTRQLVPGIRQTFLQGRSKIAHVQGWSWANEKGVALPSATGAAPAVASTEAHGKHHISLNVVGMKESFGAISTLSHIPC